MHPDHQVKRLWQHHNTRKLDAIRAEIDHLGLVDLDKAVALTSLIRALDKVDNTLGHYASYLRRWSPRSYRDVHLEIPALFASREDHQVFMGDVFDVRPDIDVELAYFDPPYGSNNEKMPPSRVRYASYYHIWKTICLNDQPELFGKAGRRVDSRDRASGSVFEDFRKGPSGRFHVVEAIERLIQQAPSPWVILSYSSGGRATARELQAVLEDNGEIVEMVALDHARNVMSSMRWTNQWLSDANTPNWEYLFLLRKG